MFSKEFYVFKIPTFLLSLKRSERFLPLLPPGLNYVDDISLSPKYENFEPLKTSQLTCTTNQLTGFSMIETMTFGLAFHVFKIWWVNLNFIYDKMLLKQFFIWRSAHIPAKKVQRRTWDPVKYLRWSLFTKIINSFWPFIIFIKKSIRNIW